MKTFLKIGNLWVNFEVIVFIEEISDDYICITTRDEIFRRIKIHKLAEADEKAKTNLSAPYDTEVDLTVFNFNILRSNLHEKIFMGEE